jgi:histidine ammonia-lyase
MMALKAIGLGRGHSGVRPPGRSSALQALLDADALPVIPSQGRSAPRATSRRSPI